VGLRDALVDHGQASSLFGQKRSDQLAAILGASRSRSRGSARRALATSMLLRCAAR